MSQLFRINLTQDMKRNSHLQKKKTKNTSSFYMQADVYVGYNAEDFISGESMRSGKSGTPADLVSENLRDHLVSGGSKLVYLEELELERERWRLRPGDLERERRRAGDRLLGERDLQGHKKKKCKLWWEGRIRRRNSLNQRTAVV